MLSPARLAFTPDGTPYSAAYDDVYHSAAGGLAQARHVFLAGNGLPQRWQGRERFVILETGFGLGLNFLATWQAWRDDPQRCGRLHFISFEQHPFDSNDLATAHRRWPELADLALQVQRQWPVLTPGIHRLHFAEEHVVLTLCFGDAAQWLLRHALTARPEAFFLDGFSPQKNPELWSPRLLKSLGQLAASAATVATWTVAGAVRDGLAQAGFVVEKAPGFASKREMLRGIYRGFPRSHGRPVAALGQARQAIVIGAGLAGTACSERLAARGWQVQLVESAASPAQGASGNHAGVLRPLPSLDDNPLARLTRAAFLHARRHLQALATAGLPLRWDACGVLHLAREPQHEQSQRQTVADQCPPADYLRFVDSAAASALAGWPLSFGGWWFPGGGWVQPHTLCHANLQRYPQRVAALFGRHVERIEHDQGQWRVFDAQGSIIASAPLLILANAADASRLAGRQSQGRLPLRVARGQVSYLPGISPQPSSPAVVVCRLGYVTPLVDGIRSAGASFIADDEGMDLRLADHRENLARLEFCLPGYTEDISAESLAGRVGMRAMTQDRMPLIGALPDAEAAFASAPGATQLHSIPRHPGLYCLLGLGARGLVWATLGAELLVAQIEGDPLPLEADLAAALDPARFLLRRVRRTAARLKT